MDFDCIIFIEKVYFSINLGLYINKTELIYYENNSDPVVGDVIGFCNFIVILLVLVVLPEAPQTTSFQIWPDLEGS